MNVFDKSVTFRFLTVIALIIGLMIPLFLVFVVVEDREHFYQDAITTISKSWASSQLIAGPVVVIPYEIPAARTDEPGETSELYVMPRTLNVQIESTHEFRYRGIFEIPILTATTSINGSFASLDKDDLQSKYGNLKLEHAYLLVGLGDPLGVRNAKLHWNQVEHQLEGTQGFGPINGGIQANDLDLSKGGSFELSVDLRYTQRLGVLLMGDDSQLNMNGSWPHPSFDGRSLPDTHSVTNSGFTGTWSSPALARGYPSVVSKSKWILAKDEITSQTTNELQSRGYSPSISQSSIHPYSFGYSVFEPITPYRAVNRSLKYGVMFVVMTLISILCIELFTKVKFHIVQYGVVGLALVVFYLVLLSLAEHIGFDWAYLIASLVLSSMIIAYAWSATKHKLAAGFIALILALLYVALYTILQLDQYSLIVGTMLLLLLLAALMIATRGLQHTEPFRMHWTPSKKAHNSRFKLKFTCKLS